MGTIAGRIACVLVGLAGCVYPVTTVPSGMQATTPRYFETDPMLVELARASPRSSERALLVIYPKSACSGTASAVITDDRGHFVGAVAPGSAALLTVPEKARNLTVFSSVEVTAPVGMWHDAKRIPVPPFPNGLLVRSARLTGRDCWTGQYVDVTMATKDELEEELGEGDLRWLTPSTRDGQAWLDRHRRRVAEVLTTEPSVP